MWVWSDYETCLRLLESDTQLQYVDKHKTTVVLSAPGDGCKSFLTGSGSFCPDSEFIDRNRIVLTGSGFLFYFCFKIWGFDGCSTVR